MTKNKKAIINVQGSAINILSKNDEDFISLTDMAKKFGGDDLLYNWMRNRNTVEFLGVWERIHNQDFKGVEFDRFKTEAEVARFITKAERKQIVTKVKAMKRDGEIHPKVQANYQDIMVLVNHIIIHCVYRKKFKSFKHSLRSAATGLRNGTWTTPKRVLAAETAERERLANEAKEQERRQCLESGFGRILGEAMRLTHGPSEADLARAKAQAVNEVVQAVGNNRAADYLQKIKDILKKPTERKEEERKK